MSQLHVLIGNMAKKERRLHLLNHYIINTKEKKKKKRKEGTHHITLVPTGVAPGSSYNIKHMERLKPSVILCIFAFPRKESSNIVKMSWHFSWEHLTSSMSLSSAMMPSGAVRLALPAMVVPTEADSLTKPWYEERWKYGAWLFSSRISICRSAYAGRGWPLSCSACSQTNKLLKFSKK